MAELATLASRWLGSDSLEPGYYHIARIVLNNSANVSVTLYGMRTGSDKFLIMSEIITP
jgi:hypothetical protein